MNPKNCNTCFPLDHNHTAEQLLNKFVAAKVEVEQLEAAKRKLNNIETDMILAVKYPT